MAINRKPAPTYWARIYIAGSLGHIKQVCREYCEVGACVNVHSADYIYTRGEQSGAVIEFINYPRFPATEDEIDAKAEALALRIAEGCYQQTYTIMTPSHTVYFDRGSPHVDRGTEI